MNNQEIVKRVAAAKDDVGVINSVGFQKELAGMSAADWQQASAIFSKSRAPKDGFYIEDNNGAVTIHNDMRNAHAHAVDSVLQSTINDGKKVAGAAVAYEASIAGAGGVLAAAIPFFGGEGVAAIGTAAVAGAGAGALLGAAALAVGGTLAGVVDYQSNTRLKVEAQSDMLTAEILRVNAEPQAYKSAEMMIRVNTNFRR